MRSLFCLFLLAVVIIASLKRNHEFVIVDTAFVICLQSYILFKCHSDTWIHTVITKQKFNCQDA